MLSPLRIEEVHWELTNHCNFKCLHCYLSEDARPELSAADIKRILDEMHAYGVLFLTLSGGEPLLRRDFPEIYRHAHERGFLINVFTNGSKISDSILTLFKELPPQKVEITLNGITEGTFEGVTAKAGSFSATMEGIRKLHEAGICLGLKTNGMTLNKKEVLAIKAFAQSMPNVFFKFDTAIMPKRDHDMAPTSLRLSAKEIFEIYERDPEMRAQIESECSSNLGATTRNRKIFQCDAATSRFHISAWGDLHPCHTVRPIRSSLLTSSFGAAAENVHRLVTAAEFSEKSACGTCSIFSKCNSCPGLAHLEGRNQEMPTSYHCEVAHETMARYSPQTSTAQ